jgi:phosphatidylserine/phosphatidylglycerophosphate/cardiolipin synthase-like enzyme
MATKKPQNGMSVKTYRGDAKTLLAFNLPKAKTKNLAGFTIEVEPKGKTPFFLQNQLRFEDPSKHAQDAKLPANSSFNAPIHKFRWLHIPGSLQQGTHPFLGEYKYTVTPRYFDNGSLLPIDKSLGTTVKVEVKPFADGKVEAGFTRGFVQSQAFVHHFGPKALFRPKNKELLFDTSLVAGKNPQGVEYTFDQEYEWLGFTARDKIFELANEVLEKSELRLDVFAYDLNEPDLMKIFLKLAQQGRIRIILDNASLHHNTKAPEPEDQFETAFNKAAKAPAEIKRGKFARFAHDKVFVISQGENAVKVLTGSTNFSVTGLYVNSNHVLVFKDARIAKTYADVFNLAWNTDVKATPFANSDEGKEIFSFSSNGVPQTEITFSPHLEAQAKLNLDNLVKRLELEKSQPNGSILFAVMGLDSGTGPVLPELRKLHADDKIFTYGISDSPGGIFVYTPHSKHGALVSGKPNSTKLPPPFDQVPQIGLGHQIHHKFVVCGFNGKKPVVYCGSSNLALGGEEENGDNLIAIHGPNIATMFALEALALVDHFDFLDRSAVKAGTPAVNVKAASKQDQAAKAGWFLSITDNWVKKYYDPNDLRFLDRTLFG